MLTLSTALTHLLGSSLSLEWVCWKRGLTSTQKVNRLGLVGTCQSVLLASISKPLKIKKHICHQCGVSPQDVCCSNGVVERK